MNSDYDEWNRLQCSSGPWVGSLAISSCLSQSRPGITWYNIAWYCIEHNNSCCSKLNRLLTWKNPISHNYACAMRWLIWVFFRKLTDVIGPGPSFSVEPSFRYKDYHYRDRMVLRLFYIYNRTSFNRILIFSWPSNCLGQLFSGCLPLLIEKLTHVVIPYVEISHMIISSLFVLNSWGFLPCSCL